MSCQHTGLIFPDGGIIHPVSGDLLMTNPFDLRVFLAREWVPERVTTGMGVVSMRNPICVYLLPDNEAPEPGSDFDCLIERIEMSLNRGERVGLGCNHGHGRTGTVLACLWGRAHSLDPQPIKTIRSAICPLMVSSWDQALFVHDYLNLPVPERSITVDTRDEQRVFDGYAPGHEPLTDPDKPLIIRGPVHEVDGRLYVLVDDCRVPVMIRGNQVVARYRCDREVGISTCGGEMAIEDGEMFCMVCDEGAEIPDEWKGVA